MKCLEYCKYYQNMTQRHKVSKFYWKKIAPIDLLNAGGPQTFNLLKNETSSKYNKMKYACIHPCYCSVAKSYPTL